MLEFTNEQIKNYLLGVVVFTIFYLLIYSKKGRFKNISGYVEAIKSCFVYAVMGIFLVVGIGLAKQISIQGEYLGLIVPLGWLLILYLFIKHRLKIDFDIDISIFKLDPVKKKEVMDILIRGIIGIGFAFSCFIILFVAVPDTENQPYGPIPLILAAILFGVVAILLMISIYFKLTNKSNEK